MHGVADLDSAFTILSVIAVPDPHLEQNSESDAYSSQFFFLGGGGDGSKGLYLKNLELLEKNTLKLYNKIL